MHACIYCMCGCMDGCTCPFSCMCNDCGYVYVHTNVHTFTHTHTHKYIHTYIHTYIHVFMHACVCVCVCVCVCRHMRRLCRVQVAKPDTHSFGVLHQEKQPQVSWTHLWNVTFARDGVCFFCGCGMVAMRNATCLLHDVADSSRTVFQPRLG
jgi:hypothetical protein